jgi:3-methyladenine DNA glycosylase/8-oxoguanine DNA glycosylase
VFGLSFPTDFHHMTPGHIRPVKDLAERFVDGRLSAEKLIAASDEELAELLIAVRGIGRVSFSRCE